MKEISEAKIKITSVISELDPSGLTVGQEERTESEAVGFFHFFEDRILLTYSENSEGGRIESEIEILPSTVTVRRKGALESELVFEEGVSRSSLYKIPPYVFDASVTAKKIRRNLSRDGGSLDLHYLMNIGGADKAARMKIWIYPLSKQI
jgi:uncharacterized beta-barrel protein YwiB (DUF1934 family)